MGYRFLSGCGQVPQTQTQGHMLGHRGPRPWNLSALSPGVFYTAVAFSISPGLKLYSVELLMGSWWPLKRDFQELLGARPGRIQPPCRKPGWGQHHGPRPTLGH